MRGGNAEPCYQGKRDSNVTGLLAKTWIVQCESCPEHWVLKRKCAINPHAGERPVEMISGAQISGAIQEFFSEI